MQRGAWPSGQSGASSRQASGDALPPHREPPLHFLEGTYSHYVEDVG